MSDDRTRTGNRTSGLLGDLESIRSLLEENEEQSSRRGDAPPRAARPEPPPEEPKKPAEHDKPPRHEEDDVPLLEDVVRGGVSLNESFLAGEGDFVDEGGERSSLNEDIFKALLSDEWRDSAREILDETRAAIEEHQADWTPQHTDELNQALKVRIDETVQQWLHEVVQERIDELRRELLRAVSAELKRTVAAHFESQREGPDGA